jgi:ABC-2 type transport system ATP-binding protein
MSTKASSIKVEHVSKAFKLPHEKNSSIKSALINFSKRNRSFERQQVLTDISFEIRQGEFFGIVGRNGSGKSTLLKLLAGIYTPDKGSISVNGKLTPFIELGVGFNPELTGRENVFLNGALLGFNHKEMEAMYDDIVAFAELERFMDQKLKNYSSGMQVRLAFSIAIRAESDILILDEVLAVGDAAFQRKCYDFFMSLKKNKRTVVLVTHDMGAVRQYCDRAIMIEAGKIVDLGSPTKVAQSYQKLFVDEAEANPADTTKKKSKTDDRWGEGGITADKPVVTIDEELIEIATSFQVTKDLPAPIYGFTLYGPSGLNICEYNTLRAKLDTDSVTAGDVVQINWEIPNILASGRYTLSVACCDQSATRFYDWLNEGATFMIKRNEVTAGAVDPKMRIATYGVRK